MFLRLINRADGIVDEGRPCLFDVIAQNMGDGPFLRETNQPFRACLEGGEVLHVQPPGIQAVSREKNRGVAVIYRYTHGVVTGNWNYVENAAAQIDLADVVRPVLNSIELLCRFKFRRHQGDRHRRIFDRLHLRVAGYVVRVGVGVDHDQRNAGASLAYQPIRYDTVQLRCKVAMARASIEEHRPVLAEEEKDEWLFVIGTSRLSQQIQVRVVLMPLPLRYFHALRPRRLPLPRKPPALYSCSADLSDLGNSTHATQTQQSRRHSIQDCEAHLSPLSNLLRRRAGQHARARSAVV